MKYGFVLGRVYSLSIAEILQILNTPDPTLGIENEPLRILQASEEILIIESTNVLNVEKLQKKLGGVIKILKIIDEITKRDQDSINFALKHYFKPSTLKKQFFKEYKGKIQFGVSLYLLDSSLAKPAPRFKDRAGKNPRDEAFNIFSEPKRLGMMIKNAMVDSGSSIRLVLPEFNSLSLASVAVSKNLLLQKGAEICLIAGKNLVYTAKTLTIQDFEDYGRRDYQRPIRDEKQGMIPPKVAQSMLNLSGCKPGSTILDPFCGIGTIVQEGLLLGFRMIGSDINKQAVKGSEQNLEWFRNRYHIPAGKYGLEVADATLGLIKLIADSGQKINAIVTECTLGPMYAEFPASNEIEKNFANLTKLYQKAFKEFSQILSPKSKIVMCFPAYRRNRDNYIMLNSIDWAKNLGYNLLECIPKNIVKQMKFLRLTARNSLIYDRKDQIVAREIVIFEKN